MDFRWSIEWGGMSSPRKQSRHQIMFEHALTVFWHSHTSTVLHTAQFPTWLHALSGPGACLFWKRKLVHEKISIWTRSVNWAHTVADSERTVGWPASWAVETCCSLYKQEKSQCGVSHPNACKGNGKKAGSQAKWGTQRQPNPNRRHVLGLIIQFLCTHDDGGDILAGTLRPDPTTRIHRQGCVALATRTRRRGNRAAARARPMEQRTTVPGQRPRQAR